MDGRAIAATQKFRLNIYLQLPYFFNTITNGKLLRRFSFPCVKSNVEHGVSLSYSCYYQLVICPLFNPQNLLPDPYYWAGNEPSLFSVFGFAHMADAGTGAAALQRHARYVLKHKYPLTPDGIPGNNDYGTMSAWYARNLHNGLSVIR